MGTSKAISSKGMKATLALLTLLACVASTSACCCAAIGFCRCNFLGCNCDTWGDDSPWPCCYWDDHFGPGEDCVQECHQHCHNKSKSKSKGDEDESPVVKEMRENRAYMDLYAQLIGIKALERFYQFDTNKDGFITPGEVLARNITIEGFNLVDLDMDGLIVPAEIDESLVIF